MEDREKKILEREAWREQAFEMRANGIKPPTFAAWKRRRAALAELFAEKKTTR